MRLFCSAFMRTASSRIRHISPGVNSPSVRQSRPDRGEGGAFWRSGITMLTLPPPLVLSPLRPGNAASKGIERSPYLRSAYGERRRNANGRCGHQVDKDALIGRVLEDRRGKTGGAKIE